MLVSFAEDRHAHRDLQRQCFGTIVQFGLGLTSRQTNGLYECMYIIIQVHKSWSMSMSAHMYMYGIAGIGDVYVRPPVVYIV